ncbi:hypothetical protein AMTRI_Chr07g23300 [Amborella trichopoda]
MFLWFANYIHCPWFSSKEMTFLKRRKREILSKLYTTCMGNSRKILYFVKDVHESYRSFIEIPIEQFSASCCIESTIQCPYFGTFSTHK